MTDKLSRLLAERGITGEVADEIFEKLAKRRGRKKAITAHHPCATCPMGTGSGAVLDPELTVPAASTIGDWLRREGLVGRSRRRRRCRIADDAVRHHCGNRRCLTEPGRHGKR